MYVAGRLQVKRWKRWKGLHKRTSSLFQAFDSGEQVKSYAASAKRNTRGKKTRGDWGKSEKTLPPSLFPPYFFPRQFFAGALIFCPLPTIKTPGTG